MIARKLRKIGNALGAMAVVLGLVLLAPAAAYAAPALTLQLAHSPNPFERLEQYGEYEVGFTVGVENSGDEATTGTYTLEDTLPPELAVKSVTAGEGWACTTTAQVIAGTPLICSGAVALAPTVPSPAVSVRMTMTPHAPDFLTNEATISGGGAATVSASDTAPVVDRPPFDIASFTARSTDEADGDYTVAGGHPFRAAARFSFATMAGIRLAPVEDPMNLAVALPSGFFGNPAAATRCTTGVIEAQLFPDCPASSIVGFSEVQLGGGAPFPKPLYNVIPDRGYPAQFAFKVGVNTVTIHPRLRPRTGSYGLVIESPNTPRFTISEIATTFYGVPSIANGSGGAKIPFLSNPVNCAEASPVSTFVADSWVHPGAKLADGSPNLSDPNWKTATAPAPPVTGCNDSALTSQFHPTIDAAPVQGGGGLQADQPAGLRVDLDFPQSNDPTDPTMSADDFDPTVPQAPALKDAPVVLPAGVSISPSSAAGLGGCSDLASDPGGDQVHYDNTKPATCPEASKIGTVTGASPLLAAHDPATDAVTGPEPIGGDVYVLKPHPGDLKPGEDGTYRLLIQVESARYGINLKLPGTATADRATGQLTATFADNPQLPVKHLQLNLKSGPRAPLATPVTCGKFTTTTDLVPWSTPGTPDATPSSSFDVASGPNGAPCASGPGQRPFAPTMRAGTESAVAGASSPFVLKLTRNDGEQEIGSIATTLPKGLTASLKGVPYCSEAAIASAAAKSGAAEQASPSCPAASQVGTLTTGAGPGSDPYYVQGKAYLAGPYKGAPLSFAFITPATAGPFDLGTVVVRAGAQVDPESAQVTVKTDPVPQILAGVPLRLRSILAQIDRPAFTRNPTGCEAKSIDAAIGGSSGAVAKPTNAFQADECAKLKFAPKLSLRLKGGTTRGDHPALKAVLTAKPGAANIARTSVALPHSEFLAQNHIRTVCTRVQFAAGAGNGAECPKGSIYGRATATTPLLDKPLSGPVYLRSSSNPLPDLVAALHGQIDFDLVGRIDSIKGGIRTTFDAVPDAPVTRFVLDMQGGKKGLLENSRNLCKSVNRASVRMDGQNGKTADFRPLLGNGCGKAKGKKGSRRHGGR